MFYKIWQGVVVKGRSFLLKILFPKRCCVCGAFDYDLCPNCERNIMLHIRAQNIKDLKVYSIFNYQDKEISSVIKNLKYNGNKRLSINLKNILQIYQNDILKNIPLLCSGHLYYLSVPLHWRRLHERGFNQSQIILKILRNLFSGIILEDVVERYKYSCPQANLDRQGRLVNLTNKFKLNQFDVKQVSSQAVLILIDDVVTTGTTLLTIYNLLKDKWPGKIVAITLASD